MLYLYLWGMVMFLHVSVILFTGGVCPIACWDTPPPDQRQASPSTRGRHPQTRHPLGPGIPQDQRQAPPRDHRQATPWDQAPPPTGAVHAGRYG